jgi:5-methylcytosine-specific restriction endonuclease McrA
MQIISRSDARISEKKRFFTGEPCIRGHVSERTTSSGQCLKCSAEFSAASRKKDPEKARAGVRASNLKNRLRRRAGNKKWRQENPETVRMLRKRYAEENKEKVAKAKAKYYQENKERCLLQSKNNRLENWDRHLNACKLWRKENRDLVRLSNRNRRKKVRDAKGTHGIKDIKRILKLQKRTCAACYTKFKGDEYHVDHIVPLALGGSNWASNLQILCPPCNMSKGAKAPLDFYVGRGFLL